MSDLALLCDLALKRHPLRSQVSSREAIDIGHIRGDLSLRDGLDNLAQAIQNRLLTRKGELKTLGHENYGSELYKLLGEPNSWKAKARAELYIREALNHENRVEEIIEILFRGDEIPQSQAELDIVVIAKAKDHDEPLRVELALNLEG